VYDVRADERDHLAAFEAREDSREEVMHDPWTLAFEIKWPFRVGERSALTPGYRPALLRVWHVDPESDGSDDSCGWSRPRLTEEQVGMVRWLAQCEARQPWYQREAAKLPSSATEAETLLRAAFVNVGRMIGKRVTIEEATRWAVEFAHNPVDNFRSSLVHLPGWHTNFAEDRPDQREETATAFFWAVARFILRERRPWWRHPRWHVRHWRLQFSSPIVRNHGEVRAA
jgi:hypothetical protein